MAATLPARRCGELRRIVTGCDGHDAEWELTECPSQLPWDHILVLCVTQMGHYSPPSPGPTPPLVCLQIVDNCLWGRGR